MSEVIDKGEISDGYHTFNELYDHRIELFMALCRIISSEGPIQRENVWKSQLHSDGSRYDGWFILGIGKKKGEQITYHLPDKLWDECNFTILPKAPNYDGHTSADVLRRIRAIV